jgi:trigger factor
LSALGSFNESKTIGRRDLGLKIETEKLEDRQTQLIIELPDDRLESAMRAAAKRLGKNTRIHGFRPGKAPYQILLNQLGEETIFEEALDHLGQEIYREALEETEIEPYAPGSLNEIVSRKPLVLRYVIPLPPDVELEAYRDIRVEHEETEVEDSAVDQVMDDLRERQALIEPADRPAELTDVVVIDVSATLEAEDHENDIELLNEKEISVLFSEEVDWPIPGIFEHLIGLEAGDEKSFEYTFPEDYTSEEIQNKTAEFTMQVHEVKSRHVPEWTDDLAKSLGEYEDLLSLRIQVRKDLEVEAERHSKNTYANQVIDKVLEDASVTFPPVLLQEEINDLLNDLQQRLKYQNLSLSDYMKIENKSEEEIIEDLKPQAETRLKRALVLGKVVEQEKIEVEDSEVDEEINRLLETFKDNASKEKADEARSLFDNPVGRQRIKLDLMSTKAIERLMAIAKGEADKISEASELAPSLDGDGELAEPEE